MFKCSGSVGLKLSKAPALASGQELRCRCLHFAMRFQQILDRFVDPITDKLLVTRIVLQPQYKVSFNLGSQPADAPVEMFLVWFFEITLCRQGEI